MIRTAPGTDPLLRRPFSVFEILRDAAGTPTGISVLCKRIGPGTTRLYDAAAGDRLARARPARQAVFASCRRRPRRGWWPAASASRRSRRSPRRCRPPALRRALFYGGRTRADLFYLDWFERRGVAPRSGDRGRLARRPTAASRCRSKRRCAPGRPASPVTLYACGPEPMLKAVAGLAARARLPVAAVDRADHGLRPRRLLQLRRARARRPTARRTSCGRASTARCSTATTSSGSDAWTSASASARSS